MPYSIGNFVFRTPGRFGDDFPGFRLMATAKLGSDGFDTLTLSCLRIDNGVVRFQPQLCTSDESAELLAIVR